MTVRSAFPFLLLVGLLAACATPAASSSAAAPARFDCPRKAFSIAYAAPVGWTGPTYAGGPALDSWTFSNGPAPTADTLETRVYDAKDDLLRWDTASDAKILASFQGTYLHPRLGRTAHVSVDGRPVRVLTLHSDGIEEYLANVYFGDSLISVMLTSSTPAGLARQRAPFLTFLQTLHFEKTH